MTDAMDITHSDVLDITRDGATLDVTNDNPEILDITHSEVMDITGPNPNV